MCFTKYEINKVDLTEEDLLFIKKSKYIFFRKQACTAIDLFILIQQKKWKINELDGRHGRYSEYHSFKMHWSFFLKTNFQNGPGRLFLNFALLFLTILN
jgi:hypothetical protein